MALVTESVGIAIFGMTLMTLGGYLVFRPESVRNRLISTPSTTRHWPILGKIEERFESEANIPNYLAYIRVTGLAFGGFGLFLLIVALRTLVAAALS